MKTFVMFLGKFPEYPHTKLHDIQPDLYCLQELYKIYNEKDTPESNNKSNKEQMMTTQSSAGNQGLVVRQMQRDLLQVMTQ